MTCGLCKQPIRGDERYTTDHYRCGVDLADSFRQDLADLRAQLAEAQRQLTALERTNAENVRAGSGAIGIVPIALTTVATLQQALGAERTARQQAEAERDEARAYAVANSEAAHARELALVAERDRAVAALRAVEWGGHRVECADGRMLGTCPACGRSEDLPHTDTCAVWTVLRPTS